MLYKYGVGIGRRLSTTKATAYFHLKQLHKINNMSNNTNTYQNKLIGSRKFQHFFQILAIGTSEF